MLNPKTIEPVHYAIYNILLLKALYKSTGDQLYLKEIEKRRSILKSSYPLFKKVENDKDIYLFSTIGPPHPYWIDIYQIIINYYSGKQLIKQSKMLPPRH